MNMSNRGHLSVTSRAIAEILTDVRQKNSMIEAGEAKRAEWAKRPDDIGDAQEILESIEKELERLDILL